MGKEARAKYKPSKLEKRPPSLTAGHVRIS